jgi:D-3-phosphoglycerate dehydrogenase / 2-oxoglutarate reductase
MTFCVLATARSFCRSDGPHHDYLRDNGCAVDLRPPEHPLSAAELAGMVAGYDGLVLGLDECDASVIAQADRLRAISRYGTGVDRVDVQAATRRGIAVTNTPGVNRVAVAELTIGLIFSLARRIPQVVINARSGVWERARGWELNGKTLGLIGLGAIGREVATRAAALGMRVLAYDPYATDDTGPAQMVNLDALLAESDIVSLHCAATPETTRLVNADRIALMKDGAHLVNTARGELVDEAALYDALSSGKLAGAASDVFQQEPPAGSPLLTLDNFIPTLHMAGTSVESVQRMALLAAENLVAVLRGDPCEHIVNPAALEARSQDDD